MLRWPGHESQRAHGRRRRRRRRCFPETISVRRRWPPAAGPCCRLVPPLDPSTVSRPDAGLENIYFILMMVALRIRPVALGVCDL